jgi:phospholipid/cholesterol/gamma-HCH transport system substrate-binding protein
MQVFRSEIKVGLLISISFLLLLTGIFVVSDIRDVWDDKKTLVILFPYADGITKGSPVWYSGLEVGAVTDIRIAPEVGDRIAVTVKINPEARVRRDSRVDIRNLGMMGAKYVEISPGSPDSPELTAGDSLEGRKPSSLSEILETGQVVAAQLVALIQETQTLVHEVRSESSLKETMQNANAFVVEMRDQGKDLKTLIQKISVFADSLNETGTHLKQVSGDGGKELTALFKELRDTNRELKKHLGAIEGRFSTTLVQVDKGVTEAEGFVKGARSMLDSSENDISSLLRNLNDTSRNLKALSEDLKAHPWKVIWRKDGTPAGTSPVGTEEWRDKGRIGPHGKD